MKKSISALIFIVIGVLIGFIITFVVNIINDDMLLYESQQMSEQSNDSDEKEDDVKKKVSKKENILEIDKDYYKDVAYKLEKLGQIFETELTSGNYVVGVDIPVGEYSLQVLEGVGQIHVNNIEQKIFISQEISDNTQEYDDTYTGIKNLKLYENTVLSISGVNVKLVSNNARTNDIREKQNNTDGINDINISSVYQAGVDFTPGVYDIEFIEGVGTVLTQGIEYGGIDISFVEDEDVVRIYKNVELPEGSKLIVNNVKIKMVPSTRGFEVNK